MEPWERFAAWQQALGMPPTYNLTDRAAVTEQLGRLSVATFTAAAEKALRGDDGTTAAAVEEDVPPGWENDTLLAQMQQVVRSGQG